MENVGMKKYVVELMLTAAAGTRDISPLFRSAAAHVKPIIEEVLAVHGGQVLVDGSGFGLAGNQYERTKAMVVETTEAGADAIKAHPKLQFNVRVDMEENKTLIHRPNGPIV